MANFKKHRFSELQLWMQGNFGKSPEFDTNTGFSPEDGLMSATNPFHGIRGKPAPWMPGDRIETDEDKILLNLDGSSPIRIIGCGGAFLDILPTQPGIVLKKGWINPPLCKSRLTMAGDLKMKRSDFLAEEFFPWDYIIRSNRLSAHEMLVLKSLPEYPADTPERQILLVNRFIRLHLNTPYWIANLAFYGGVCFDFGLDDVPNGDFIQEKVRFQLFMMRWKFSLDRKESSEWNRRLQREIGSFRWQIEEWKMLFRFLFDPEYARRLALLLSRKIPTFLTDENDGNSSPSDSRTPYMKSGGTDHG